MKLLIAGSSGLIGQALVSSLKGHAIVKKLVRGDPRNPYEVSWDPYREEIPQDELEGLDALINLSGENLAGYWTSSKKKKILESRLITTRFLAKSISQCDAPPKVFINASAVGFYGLHAEGSMTEISPQGDGFLARVCREWEAATELAIAAVPRVIQLRLGPVLSAKGGMLQKMLTPFKLGLGGVIGSGHQMVSWIAIDDVIKIVEYCIKHPNLRGPVNATAPHPVTNREFTKTLGKVLHRPTLFPMPAFIAKLILGEMAEEMLLNGVAALPEKLLTSGYEFKYPNLEQALMHVLHYEDNS